jgi:glucose-1-phosphate cytidylyltransferase
MKVIILAGGLGTRISEETSDKPKPMVLLDQNPIIWHIMNTYAHQGFMNFVIAGGYMHEVISNWASNLESEWDIEVLDTGLNTQTGGRIKQCINHVEGENFLVTYGDGLANINISKLIDFHNHQGRIATVTAVRPPARFGVLESSNGRVIKFGEKNQTDSGWINGGFFVLNRKIADYIYEDTESFESLTLPRVVKDGELSAYHHEGFWQPMDTLRERNELAALARDTVPIWLNID